MPGRKKKSKEEATEFIIKKLKEFNGSECTQEQIDKDNIPTKPHRLNFIVNPPGEVVGAVHAIGGPILVTDWKDVTKREELLMNIIHAVVATIAMNGTTEKCLEVCIAQLDIVHMENDKLQVILSFYV